MCMLLWIGKKLVDNEIRAVASTGTTMSSTFDIVLFDTPRTKDVPQ